MKKTNALRLLDRDGIGCTLHNYDVFDGNIDGKAVADKVGKPREQVFKTLVTRGASGENHVFVQDPGY